jgi:hypothetical protein
MNISTPAENRATGLVALVELSSKLFAVGVAVVYLVGFLVVSANVYQYGVISLSVFQLQYLIAGGWALGPPIAMAAVFVTALRFEGPTVQRADWLSLLRLAVLTVLPLMVPIGLLLVLLMYIPGVVENLTWHLGVVWLFFVAGMVACVRAVWASWRAGAEPETRWLNRRNAAPYLVVLVMLGLIYVLWFSVRIYPWLPSSLGGGEPLTVAFFPRDKNLPDPLKPDLSTTGRSLHYRLLLMTDKDYVLLSDSPKERSIVLSRDSVSGMVVLGTYEPAFKTKP